MKFLSCLLLHEYWFFLVIEDCSFHLLHIFSVWLINQYLEHLATSTEVTLLFNLKNHSKTYVLPIVCSPKATLNTWEFSISFSPEHKLMEVHSSSLPFPGTPKSHVEHTLLVLNYTAVTYATVIFQAGNDWAPIGRNSSTVIPLSVLKLFDRTTYHGCQFLTYTWHRKPFVMCVFIVPEHPE